MRDWHLGAGDPLCLTLAADARLEKPDYFNDHIWELELGGGEPSALALRTTYGLRALSMRIFPRFVEQGKSVSNPASFVSPPLIRRFYPNFLVLSFSPFVSIQVDAEYWVPSSQAVAVRLTFTNTSAEAHHLRLEWAGLLVPLDGQSLTLTQMQAVNLLAGKTSNLSPVVFLTGGAQIGPGPYPSLMLEVNLAPGASRQFTLTQVALDTIQKSFELARRTAARTWDAERAKIELLNASQTIEVFTGDLDWDATFAFSQKTALGFFYCANEYLPNPSFVSARQPDHGYSRQGDGSDYPHLWSGQSPLESYYLYSLLSGIPALAEGLLKNFLSAQANDGTIDCRPGLVGQRVGYLASPMLASLAWAVFEQNEDRTFLDEVYSPLLLFFNTWFAPAHDRDGDGFPEWHHNTQTDFEDNPMFSLWERWGQGVDITTIESPSLAAMLYRECRTLIKIANVLDRSADCRALRLKAESLRAAVEECWDTRSALYHVRDRDTHYQRTARLIAERYEADTINLWQTHEKPIRLLIGVQAFDGNVRRPEIVITGRGVRGEEQVERLVRRDFQWTQGRGVATSQKVYSNLSKVETNGLAPQDLVIIQTVNYTDEDQTLFLPLWAEIPNKRRAKTLVKRSLLNTQRFYHPFGVSACSTIPDPAAEPVCASVHLSWNHLIGEGLLAYSLRAEAAQLTARLMASVVASLKKRRGFYQTYHADTGTGMGERGMLCGLAPLGLFLKTLGVQFLSGGRVRLEGQNPFPWPVTVKYRGLSVIRHEDHTEIIFPNGQVVTTKETTLQVIRPQ